MCWATMTKRVFVLATGMFLVAWLTATVVRANDTIAEITPQGLQFRVEAGIAMAEEELYISRTRGEVSYRFRNLTDRDIRAEVAFPVPPFHFQEMMEVPHSRSPLNFDDFHVEVDGRRVEYRKEVRALVEGQDHSEILRSLGVSIEDFGRFDWKLFVMQDLDRLGAQDRVRLEQFGLLVPEQVNGRSLLVPNWTVAETYHWTQNFPAGAEVGIRHRYTPYHGGMYLPYSRTRVVDLSVDAGEVLEQACIDDRTRHALEQRMQRSADDQLRYMFVDWVSYILTTATNWSGPIGRFHLVLDKPAGSLLSLCLDEKLTKTGPNRFEAWVDNFVPRKDLRVYYFDDGLDYRRRFSGDSAGSTP